MYQLLAIGVFALLVVIVGSVVAEHINGSVIVALCTALGGLCTLLAALAQSQADKKR